MPSWCRIGGRRRVGSWIVNDAPRVSFTVQLCHAGDFIVDDDGMGYADIGEEEDWGRSDQKGAKETDDHLTSKKRKDGSTAGQAAQLLSCTLPMRSGCGVRLYFGAISKSYYLQIKEAARGKASSQISKPSSACKACSSEPQLGLCNAPQRPISPVKTS